MAQSAEERARNTGFVLVAAETQGGDAVGFVQVTLTDKLAHLEQLSVLPLHGRRVMVARWSKPRSPTLSCEALRRSRCEHSLRSSGTLRFTLTAVLSKQNQAPHSTWICSKPSLKPAARATAGGFK
jgi:hypothetical protein